MPKTKPSVIRRRKMEATGVSVPRTAIVMQPPAVKPWELNLEEVNILKNAICKGATDDELKFCVAVARRYKLDPFKREIHFTPRWDSQAERTDGKKGATVWVPVVGIDGLQHIAARDHADYGSFSEVEYGPMVTVTWTDSRQKTQNFQAPEWARIEAWKKGAAQPTIGKVWWSEIYPDVDRAPLVRRMPRLMLGKCAKAQAIRAAYPVTGGLLIPEETHNREFTDITPGGRLITRPDPDTDNPHLRKYLEREQEGLSKLTPAQREVLEAKMSKKAEVMPSAHDIPQVGSAVAGEMSHPAEQHASVGAEPRRAECRTESDRECPTGISGDGAKALPAEMPTAPITLFVRYYPQSDTYQIKGVNSLPDDPKKIAMRYYVPSVKAIVCNGEQLDALKWDLDAFGVTLKPEK
jgi:hypothetical protein